VGDVFDEVLSNSVQVSGGINVESVGPPRLLAVLACLLGLAGIGFAFSLSGSAAWLSWGIGLASVLSGVIYKAVVRQRQVFRFFLMNVLYDRLMLLGVLLGFIGIALSALHIAERPVQP
jgi:hypothetical protein